MKSAFAIFVILISALISSKAGAQVVAIGHVSAEVIESVSASAKPVTGFSLIPSNNNITEAASINPETINLGTMTINSGTNVACNVVVRAANLTDSKGNGFTIDPVIEISNLTGSMRSDGSSTIQINGTPLLSSNQQSGLYKGNYTMVFAYN